MSPLLYDYAASPVGDLLLAGTEEALWLLSFPTGRKTQSPRPDWRRAEVQFRDTKEQLAAYFGGELRLFDIAIHLSGTPFQCSVWRSLADIPFGETRTYGEIATSLGRPKAGRAVGAANAENPLPIILPCHRVIGAGGALTGFGGGLPTKAHLLRHEGASWSKNRSL